MGTRDRTHFDQPSPPPPPRGAPPLPPPSRFLRLRQAARFSHPPTPPGSRPRARPRSDPNLFRLRLYHAFRVFRLGRYTRRVARSASCCASRPCTLRRHTQGEGDKARQYHPKRQVQAAGSDARARVNVTSLRGIGIPTSAIFWSEMAGQADGVLCEEGWCTTEGKRGVTGRWRVGGATCDSRHCPFPRCLCRRPSPSPPPLVTYRKRSPLGPDT